MASKSTAECFTANVSREIRCGSALDLTREHDADSRRRHGLHELFFRRALAATLDGVARLRHGGLSGDRFLGDCYRAE